MDVQSGALPMSCVGRGQMLVVEASCLYEAWLTPHSLSRSAPGLTNLGTTRLVTKSLTKSDLL